MRYQPRTIALLAEVVHPPLAPDPRVVQRLHNEAYQAGPPPWASFTLGDSGPSLSNPATHPGHVSQASFLPDRLLVREEQSAVTVEEFAERTAHLAGRYAQERSIGVFLAQVVTLRTLVNARHQRDTRALLAQDLMRLGDSLSAFERAPATVGLRLAFTSAHAEQPAVGLRIESYNADPRSLFLEVQATYGPVVSGSATDALRQRVHGAYEILQNEVLEFVARHDQPQGEAGGEA